MVVFVNACVRAASRTKRIANVLLARLNDETEEVKLSEFPFPTTDEAFLRQRDSLIAQGKFDAPMFSLARQFAEADTVVIAAPFWDLSFPAALKQYIEQINVVGITFRYTKEGIPQGMCRARKLYYVTTAGGNYVPEAFGFGYIKALAEGFYGIPDVRLIQAAGLDIDGADGEGILRACMDGLAVNSQQEG